MLNFWATHSVVSFNSVHVTLSTPFFKFPTCVLIYLQSALIIAFIILSLASTYPFIHVFSLFFTLSVLFYSSFILHLFSSQTISSYSYTNLITLSNSNFYCFFLDYVYLFPILNLYLFIYFSDCLRFPFPL
jgi:hypothetical protein